MSVDVSRLPVACERIVDLATSGTGSYICVSNVHMCMEVHDNAPFAEVVNGADLVVADGRPIFWAQRLLGFPEAHQVRGQDLMNALCQRSLASGLKVGLFGGATDDVLQLVKTKLATSYPGIDISYCYSPPFKKPSEAEMAQLAADINKAEVQILFVGIGCPKQELWMAAQKGHVHCVMLGVGAAFDFISGSKSHAPKWMQYLGLEWLFRLVSEPGRLWKRYLIQNPRFIFFFVKQLLLGAK
jgi:N-acetylglucosaminyldiphosphoundecaprenol N-acetyl-beta-D-mannosaminyltransferase